MLIANQQPRPTILFRDLVSFPGAWYEAPGNKATYCMEIMITELRIIILLCVHMQRWAIYWSMQWKSAVQQSNILMEVETWMEECMETKCLQLWSSMRQTKSQQLHVCVMKNDPRNMAVRNQLKPLCCNNTLLQSMQIPYKEYTIR